MAMVEWVSLQLSWVAAAGWVSEWEPWRNELLEKLEEWVMWEFVCNWGSWVAFSWVERNVGVGIVAEEYVMWEEEEWWCRWELAMEGCQWGSPANSLQLPGLGSTYQSSGNIRSNIIMLVSFASGLLLRCWQAGWNYPSHFLPLKLKLMTSSRPNLRNIHSILLN